MSLTRWRLAVILLGAASAGARRPYPVTWADFSHVRWVASSMSHVYFVTTEGITRYNKLQRQWEEPLTGAPGIDYHDLRRVWVSEFDDHLWAATSDVICEYDRLLGRWYSTDSPGEVGEQTRHVNIPTILYAPFSFNYSGDGYLIDRYGRSFAFTDALDDGSGILWLASWGYGAATAGSNTGIIELLPCGLIQNRVDALLSVDSLLWVGGHVGESSRSGITGADLRDMSFSYVESGLEPAFPATDVNCLGADDSALYVGTDQGLYVLSRGSLLPLRHLDRRRGLPDDSIVCLEKIGDSLLVGTALGLALITTHDDSINVTIPSGLHNLLIYDIEAGPAEIWLATSGGAYRLTRESAQLQRLQDPGLVLSRDVFDVERVGDNIWFAGVDGVLKLDRKTAEFEAFAGLEAWSDQHALAANEDIVAAVTGRGVVIIDHRSRGRDRWEFTVQDGLPSERVHALKLIGEYLWIGSDGGLTRLRWVDL